MKRYPSRRPNILSLILSFLGTISIFWLAFLSITDDELKNECYFKTTAVISDVIYDSESKSYYPEFTYTYNGEEHIIVSKISSPKLKHKKGKTVEFYIDPQNLNKHYCPSESNINTGFLFFFGFGIVLLAGSIIHLMIYISTLKQGPYKKFTLF